MDKKVIFFGRKLIELGQDFVIAKVVETRGSTPRKKGAWLLMKSDGTRVGTVGGGLVEAETEKLCMEAFKTKESHIHRFSLDAEAQNGLDMRCGGDAEISIEYIDASNPETFSVDFGEPPKAFIFGAGHVGLAVEPILRYVDFLTYVLDDRDEYANRERFPDAEEVMVIDDYEHGFDNIDTDEDSYIIIVTRGHMGDYEILRDALRKPSGYIGMIGSRSKVAGLKKMLLAEGFSEEDFNRVHTPIGIEIQAETPEEIAISITAEVIRARVNNEKQSC